MLVTNGIRDFAAGRAAVRPAKATVKKNGWKNQKTGITSKDPNKSHAYSSGAKPTRATGGGSGRRQRMRYKIS